MRAGLKSYVKVMTLNHADSSSIAFRDTAASGIACNYFSVQCRNLSGAELGTSAEVGYFFVAPSAGHVMSSVDLTPVGISAENGPESGSGTVELIIRKPLYSNAIVASATQGHYVDITASAAPYPNTDAGHGAGGVAGTADSTVEMSFIPPDRCVGVKIYNSLGSLGRFIITYGNMTEIGAVTTNDHRVLDASTGLRLPNPLAGH